MALKVYKPGQGYWTRTLSAIGFGTVVLWGVVWFWNRMQGWFQGDDNVIYYQSIMAVALIGAFGIVLYFMLGAKQNTVEFMIATETEMKKVNWPSRKEIIGSTIVVVAGTAMIAGILLLINLGFGWLFKAIGVLEG